MANPRICSITDCDKRVHGRGWCGLHYERWRIHGDPLGGGTTPGEPLRFLETVAVPFWGDKCLIWPFSRDSRGYGQVWCDGRLNRVHRLVCEHVHGPSPTPKHETAHSCGRRACVNPVHLRWATSAENHADKLLHGTHNRGERNAGAKLTEADVLEIRALEGMMLQREIGAMFGISDANVGLIQHRERWAWLD